jgi:hypothetical protein
MNTLIKNSIEYYDIKYPKLFKDNQIIRRLIVDNESDLKKNDFISIDDKNNKINFKSKYEVLCKIDKINSLIIWSWSLPEISKNKTFISRELLNYGLDLSDKSLIELKHLLTSSKIKYKNNNSLEILLKIFLFLTKKDSIYIDGDLVMVLFDLDFSKN